MCRLSSFREQSRSLAALGMTTKVNFSSALELGFDSFGDFFVADEALDLS